MMKRKGLYQGLNTQHPPGETTMSDLLVNVHPADELAAIREEIKLLETRESDLRSRLLKGTDQDREGDQYRAFIQSGSRKTIDTAAIVAALGEDIVAPFMKTTSFQTLKLAKKEN